VKKQILPFVARALCLCVAFFLISSLLTSECSTKLGRLGAISVSASESEPTMYHTFSIDPTDHDLYGLTYPITYEFSIPDGSSNLRAYKKYDQLEDWVQIIEKTSNDFFNGIEAVRFNYSENKAYVSVSFVAKSDSLYLSLTNSDGEAITTKFDGITEYYDGRGVSVVFTIDDIGAAPPWGGEENFTLASKAFAEAEVWWTAGFVTDYISSGSSWEVCQEGINRGFLEVASHSRTHPSVPFGDYDSEIGGSRDEIIEKLDLPYKKGSKKYVWCWIDPNGVSDDTVQEKLGEYRYLVHRMTYSNGGLATHYEEWNYTYGVYDGASTSIYMDSSSLTELNNAFDSVYVSGGIYHAWGHVGMDGWEPGMKGYEHIQHVKGKKDVWYVGFGHLYAYAHTRWCIMTEFDAKAHVYIENADRGDLIVDIGVGKPSGPCWLKRIWNGEEKGEANLDLSVNLSEALAYLPPRKSEIWFLQVYDRSAIHEGQITEFSISFQGKTYASEGTPVPVRDLETSYAYIPNSPRADIFIEHTYIGDLIVTIGVRDQSVTLWSKVIWSRDGDWQHNLNLTVDLTDALAWLPPNRSNTWYLQVYDAAHYSDVGQIRQFSITCLGYHTLSSLDVPVPINYLETSYAYILGDVFELPAGTKQADPTLKNSLDESGRLIEVDINGSGQTAYVAPGETISATYTCQIYSAAGDPSEVNHGFFILSWTPSWPPPTDYYIPIWEGTPGVYPGVIETGSFNFSAPTTPGTYYLYWCGGAKDTWAGAVARYREPLDIPAHARIIVEALHPRASIFIEHTWVGDLNITIGVGDPSAPAWSEVVWNRQGGSQHNLNLTVDLSAAIGYLPPSTSNAWYLKVYDAGHYDEGRIVSFNITYNGVTYSSSSVPVPIKDCQTSYAYIPT